MSMPSWNPAAVKAQLRVATQRLAQLQEKKDSQGQITRRDIATLLQQNDVELARAKAQNLLQDDILGDLLEILEMHVGLILEHFNEIDKIVTPSPGVVEAASSIIYAAPRVGSRDLGIVRDILVQRLGSDFARSAANNHDSHVAPRVVRALSAPPPTALQLDHQLANIAATYFVKWMPEPSRQDILNELSELLDAETSPTLDLDRLRTLCAQGLPDDPPWLRPRLWKIFFGILSTTKTSWKKELQNQRESYYSLVCRLLTPFSTMLPPTSPLEFHDATLLNVSKLLDRIPPPLLAGLQKDPETNDLCPLDDRAPHGIKIDSATNLDTRLRSILEKDSKTSHKPLPNFTPEIRIEADDDTGTFDVSVSSVESPQHHASTTLLYSKAYNSANAHQGHMSALLRLLYLHSCINPAIQSPQLPSLLVSLYSVLLFEIEPNDLAHAEADTFWLFETMIGEFSELLDEEGNSVWMKRLGERVAWADEELCTDLCAIGLDPALPHYSHRWLAPLLTQTIPLSSVFTVWDAMFSRPLRDRKTNPKIDYLLDFCTAMLIRAKPALFSLGKFDGRHNGLWTHNSDSSLPPSLSVSQFGDAFLEGISLLQQYSVESAGGIDRLLQTASDLSRRRTEETKLEKADHQGLGARLKASVWKGLSRIPSPEDETRFGSDSVVPDDGNETETPQSGITSRLAQTVWKSITNQTAMEAPASPATPSSSSPPTTPPTTASDLDNSSPRSSISSLGSGSLWSYAEKLKDSDTVASLTKASTNWRAKAMLGWGMGGVSMHFSPTTSEKHPRAHAESSDQGTPSNIENGKHVYSSDINAYMPPERPAYFRPPRDSILPQPRRSPTSSPGSPEMSPQSESSLLSKAHLIRASLSSLSRSSNTPPPEVKTVPRPLLLSSTSLITSPRSSPSPSSTFRGDPALDRDQWSAVIGAKGESMHKASQSSTSSLSASDTWGRSPGYETRSDSDSGAPSRIVPLNRKSVSPMAAGIRTPMRRPTSPASSGTSSDRGFASPTESMQPLPLEVMKLQVVTSAAGINSPPSDHEHYKSTLSTEPNPPPIVSSRRMPRRVPHLESEADDTSDSSLGHTPSRISRTPRLTRRNPPNLNLRTREPSRPERVTELKTISPNSLTAEYPIDYDIATTPKAASFEHSPTSGSRSPHRTRKHSGENVEGRPRKVALEGNDTWPRKSTTELPPRTRKISEGRARDSAAIEGDDEGYDDLLSAYESEERHQ